MTVIRSRTLILLAAVSVLSVMALWLLAVPAVISRSTFAFLSVFVIGGAAVSLTTWRNAQPTGSMGQLLYRTEMDAVRKTPSATGAAAVGSAWETWQIRGIGLDKVGKQRMLIALLLTMVLLGIFAWLA
jgi:hypothetical protein